MDRETTQSFIRTADGDLASIRSSLLIITRTGDASDLATPRRALARLKADASQNGQVTVAAMAADCETALDRLATTDELSPTSVYPLLDIVARLEASLFDVPIHSADFLDDINGFVDASFDGFMSHPIEPPTPTWSNEEFEIDDETVDIFRTEADELLTKIANNISTLRAQPADQNALWEIRRNAHTFKGAAGIVGLKDASEVAHRMEDLLDKMVELGREAAPQVVDFLHGSSRALIQLVAARSVDNAGELDRQYSDVMKWVSSGDPSTAGNALPVPTATAEAIFDAAIDTTVEPSKPAPAPIVRVSLDRLDDLLKISRSLVTNRSALAEKILELRSAGLETKTLESLVQTQHNLTTGMQQKLLSIRMVRFGTLETRLNRAVNVTCQEENKGAVLTIENPDVEIDTQLIDAMIEPLLHLLKNAIVHGIEPPETRRLLGKPEKGSILISIETDDTDVYLKVEDDGRGISSPKLIEKAVANGIIDDETADAMTEQAGIELIFERGLTTAQTLSLNAGRGVGMSIVRESVQSRGGDVLVTSEPQRGTVFTVRLPLVTGSNTEAKAKTVEGPARPVILIVDDSDSIRRITSIIVEAAGFRAITAVDGADALDMLRTRAWVPDLILSDVEMPNMNGWEFLEYIKQDESFGHIPVVMVTSLDSDESRQRAMALSASDYMVKPFSGKDLERIFAELVLLQPA
jgi:chemotaxis protein histidine kinase CheA/ActR/RegA family two-component response regulator